VYKLSLLLPIVALAACGQEPAPAPAPTAAATPAEPSLPAPTLEVFAAVFGETCPKAEKVSTSVCKRAGMGSKDVLCQFGVGEDAELRHKATLTAGEGEWKLADAETVCAEHDSHHVAS
jgi:hypothetical protein